MRTALVREPGPRRARVQHGAYVDALAEAGFAIRRLEPAGDRPDTVFVEDTAVVCGDRAVLASPGEPGRAAEVSGTAEALGELGLEVLTLDGACVMEGGDVLQTADALYMGRSARTDDEALCLLPPLLPARRVVVVKVLGAPHLRSAMAVLPDGSLLGVPDLIDTSGLPGLRVAPEPSGAGMVALGGDHLLLAASAPRTAALLRADGWRVTAVDISEFEALDGTVNRLSLIV
ncbi:dimethylarginine dimethylaminohydrolase family protein [Actinocorallia populi]|uniref:dimethylarginine dimethylaminohydrolase family protein n=1 Tax=Actinocorallia populi TaxID=2079200 RepID=UPI000D087804|nr:N(G),N(G)-dimethylarginine dimethylaminohydrolase [Actinocorallia populi]